MSHLRRGSGPRASSGRRADPVPAGGHDGDASASDAVHGCPSELSDSASRSPVDANEVKFCGASLHHSCTLSRNGPQLHHVFVTGSSRPDGTPVGVGLDAPTDVRRRSLSAESPSTLWIPEICARFARQRSLAARMRQPVIALPKTSNNTGRIRPIRQAGFRLQIQATVCDRPRKGDVPIRAAEHLGCVGSRTVRLRNQVPGRERPGYDQGQTARRF